ncbi:hypothetical protein Tco_0892029 [Tanacetum coccineum]|uniref:Uncharacterized protein n=1 Tax=Tanacetum coccineum TaxID=301880 RepID=A0ABQ5C7R5_9ASTR
MEDDTFLVDSMRRNHAGHDDAHTPQPMLLGGRRTLHFYQVYMQSIDRCMGRIDLLELSWEPPENKRLGEYFDTCIPHEVDLEGLSRMASDALGHDQAMFPLRI